MFENMCRLGILSVVLGGALTACATNPNLANINNISRRMLVEAKQLQAEGKLEEAAVLLFRLQELHPNDMEVKELLGKMSEEQMYAVGPHPILGYGKMRRARVQPSIAARILFYIPDRILDILDVVSFGLGGGYGCCFKVWATRAVNLNFYGGVTMLFGWNYKRQLSLDSFGGGDISLGPIGASATVGTRAGTAGIDTVVAFDWLHRPDSAVYQEYSDYWGIGGLFHAVFIAAYFEVHPIEIADFLAGLILFDPLNDDLATTRSVRIGSSREQLMDSLHDRVRELDQDSLARYQKTYASVGADDPGKTAAKGAVVVKKEEKEPPRTVPVSKPAVTPTPQGDRVEMRSGRVHYGSVIGQDREYVLLRSGGRTMRLPKRDIRRLRYQ